MDILQPHADTDTKYYVSTRIHTDFLQNYLDTGWHEVERYNDIVTIRKPIVREGKC
jgi:hypothetical protein